MNKGGSIKLLNCYFNISYRIGFVHPTNVTIACLEIDLRCSISIVNKNQLCKRMSSQ